MAIAGSNVTLRLPDEVLQAIDKLAVEILRPGEAPNRSVVIRMLLHEALTARFGTAPPYPNTRRGPRKKSSGARSKNGAQPRGKR
jgi:hypothetical protein